MLCCADGVYLIVSHGVVPVEKAWCNIIRHHHVHAVVLMSCKDEEHAYYTQQPAEPVVQPHPAWGVCNGGLKSFNTKHNNMYSWF